MCPSASIFLFCYIEERTHAYRYLFRFCLYFVHFRKYDTKIVICVLLAEKSLEKYCNKEKCCIFAFSSLTYCKRKSGTAQQRTLSARRPKGPRKRATFPKVFQDAMSCKRRAPLPAGPRHKYDICRACGASRPACAQCYIFFYQPFKIFYYYEY